MNKEDRIKLILECLTNLQEIKNEYIAAFPSWILLNAAQGDLKSLYHIETETNLDDETLGVKYET